MALHSLDTAHGRTWLWQPPVALAGCLRAVLGWQSPGPFRSCYPATPLTLLGLWRTGEARCDPRPGFVQHEDAAPGAWLRLAGPFTGPSAAASEGPCDALQLAFHADALQQLTGVDLVPLCNRMVDARDHLPAAWVEALRHVMEPEAIDTRLQRLTDFLTPLWQGRARTAPQRYADWLDALLQRAATSGSGRSLRMLERRIKAWAGVPLRDLRAVSRAETAYFATVHAGPGWNWSEVALQSAYSDQPHFCRETRRLTGFTPTELTKRIESDPAFWVYRLWR